MRRLPWLLVLVAVGCKINVDQPTVNKPADTTTASTKPEASTTGASTTTTGTASKPSATSSTTSTGTSGTTSQPASGAKTTSGSSSDKTAESATKPSASSTDQKALTTADLKKMPGFNPSRIYQLSTFKTVNLGVNGHTLKSWIADTANKQQEGLMFVKDKDMTDDESMIFVYSNAGKQNFWMKHTYIPLDIAYIGTDKKVVSTATMKPFDETSTPSGGPAQYALEMKVGSLARLGISKGTTIDIPASVKSDVPVEGPPQPQFGGGAPMQLGG